MKKKETYLMIIRQNTLKRIKIQFVLFHAEHNLLKFLQFPHEYAIITRYLTKSK